jgi:hypothetical protein
MKDALLDNTTVPIIAMWRDESLTIPNRAARRLFHPAADLSKVKDGYDLVSKVSLFPYQNDTCFEGSRGLGAVIRAAVKAGSRKSFLATNFFAPKL